MIAFEAPVNAVESSMPSISPIPKVNLVLRAAWEGSSPFNFAELRINYKEKVLITHTTLLKLPSPELGCAFGHHAMTYQNRKLDS
jgi:hypothetical protein